MRTAQAYFDVLAAQDTLALVGAQKAAISEQLAQAKRNFEVGTATITDTHEAQARYDLIIAQEIAAQNDLESKRRALQLITGKEYEQLKPLRADIRLAAARARTTCRAWVDIAEKQAYPVLAQEAATEVAQLEAKRKAPAHLPTLDLVGTYGTTEDTGSLQTGDRPRHHDRARSACSSRIPLYQGGAHQLARARSRRELLQIARRPRERPAHRGADHAPDLPRGDQRHRAGGGARAGAHLLAERARLEPARLRGRRAHQHRRAERPAAALLHAPRPRGGALQRHHSTTCGSRPPPARCATKTSKASATAR